MEIERQLVTIWHPRMPYNVYVEGFVDDNEPVCIIALTNGFFRVLHIKSGLALTDTRGIKPAVDFVKAVNKKYLFNQRFAKLMDGVSMIEFCRDVKLEEGLRADYERLFRNLEHFSSLEGHVSKTTTRGERYLFPPEFIT